MKERDKRDQIYIIIYIYSKYIYIFTNFEMQKLIEYQTVLKTEKTLSCDNVTRILSNIKSFLWHSE